MPLNEVPLSTPFSELSFLDLIDVVNDPVASGDYKEEEDPTIFVSLKTQRGPLTPDWIETDADKNFIPRNGCTDVMCAYKLIRVEFRYWGMQNRIEKFIHDVGKCLFHFPFTALISTQSMHSNFSCKGASNHYEGRLDTIYVLDWTSTPFALPAH